MHFLVPMRPSILVLPVVAFAFAHSLGAQVRSNPLYDSSAARIFARAVRGTEVHGISGFLRQVGRPQPRAKLDEVADSLVQLAIRGGDGTLDATVSVGLAQSPSR
jgi:hypothetical protein